MTLEERKAIGDAYTTLRAIYTTLCEHRPIAEMCLTSAEKLEKAFPQIQELAKAIEESEPTA